MQFLKYVPVTSIIGWWFPKPDWVPVTFGRGSFFDVSDCLDGSMFWDRSQANDQPSVITASREVELMFILCFHSNSNAFYLYMATSVPCSSTPRYAHTWLYKGCGYCMDLSVSCTSFLQYKKQPMIICFKYKLHRSVHVLLQLAPLEQPGKFSCLLDPRICRVPAIPPSFQIFCPVTGSSLMLVVR